MLAIPSATVRLGPRGGWVEAFEIDRTEVTVAEYTRCVTRTECAAPPTDGACNYGREGRAEHPINCVSLSEAARYCATLGKRLPSEVEWEYAARGASPTIPLVEFQSSKDACVERTNPGTCPVAQHPKSTSPFGAEDMLGNVWEWTRDISKTFDGKEEAVVKGGGWSGPRVALWVHASRPAQARADDLGFRCAKDRTPVPPPFDGHR
jgi:formylglycine-generating enzyme required for sulfatase activity